MTSTPPGPSHKNRAPSKITVHGNDGVKVVRSCVIRRPAAELYSFWRNLENLPRIIKHPVSIVRVSDIESHWSVSAPPGDRRVEWDSLIINDEADRLIAWRTREGAEIPHAGSVRFETAPGNEGTKVTVALEYDAPGGKFGAWVAKLSGEEPGQQVEAALERFKELMEMGETPRT